MQLPLPPPIPISLRLEAVIRPLCRPHHHHGVPCPPPLGLPADSEDEVRLFRAVLNVASALIVAKPASGYAGVLLRLECLWE